ncbi:MAG TPA: MFS transporter [Vicinamibacterales bacterium]|nr:MFS transporter [Vicinamibacterales bacterium]
MFSSRRNFVGADRRLDAEIIGLVGFAHGVSHFYHLMLPPLFPWLMTEFGLTFTQVGLLTTTFFVVSGVGQALAGFLVDRIGASRVLFAGIATLALSGVVLGVSSSYPMLILTAAIAGAGNSVFHPADFTLLNQRVTHSQLGHAFSIHALSGNLGWAAGPVFMAGLAGAAGRHAAGFGAAAVGSLALVLLYTRRHVLSDAAAELVVAGERGAAIARTAPLAFLRSGAVWLCFSFFFLTTTAFGILQNYAPAILSQVYGVSLVFASGGLTAYLLGSGAGVITGGFLAPHGDRVVAPSLGFAALMALVLASGALPSAALWPLMAALGFGVGMASPARDLLVRQAATARFGKTSFGRVYGFVYSGLDTGLAISPMLFGPLLDAGRFNDALIAVALLQVAALTTAWRVGSGARAAEPKSAPVAASQT